MGKNKPTPSSFFSSLLSKVGWKCVSKFKYTCSDSEILLELDPIAKSHLSRSHRNMVLDSKACYNLKWMYTNYYTGSHNISKYFYKNWNKAYYTKHECHYLYITSERGNNVFE